MAQAWVNVQGGLGVFRCIVCDANMCPEDFKRSFSFLSEHMCGGPKRSVDLQINNFEWCVDHRTYDYVIACHSFRGKISQMKVVEDFESVVVERETRRYKGME